MSVNLETMSDLCTPWCLHVTVTLRIAESIEAGQSTISDLAKASACDARALHSVLGHLVRKGIFEEPSPGQFALNDPARALLDPGMRIGLDLNGIGGRMASAWATLPEYVRTGRPAYKEEFDLPFWQDLDAHPAVAESFDALIGPTGHGTPSADFNLTIPWDSIKTVVDVGGNTGAMIAALLAKHPHLQGTLMDLPRTVARATPRDRLTCVGQSFFDPLPAGADVYLLRGVINDWPDEEAIKILQRCAEAAGAQGRVVILKSVGPSGIRRRLDIEMLLVGGKHRSIDEFRPLANAAGLEVLAAEQQPDYFVVECKVPSESQGRKVS